MMAGAITAGQMAHAEPVASVSGDKATRAVVDRPSATAQVRGHGEKPGAPGKLPVDADGTITGTDTLRIPLSSYLSPEGKAAYSAFLAHQFPAASDIKQYRAMLDEYLQPYLDQWKTIHPVEIEATEMGGVAVDVVKPKGGVGARNENRVVIVLHGGGFMVGEGIGGLIESVPVAGVGKIKVVSVRYRQGPEHRFPAASEDVAAVYSVLLKHYRPENIAIQGCSAGGVLTGQSIVWFQKHDLPRPGAIGMFCAALDFLRPGDSTVTAKLLNATPLATPNPMPAESYLQGADMKDPLVTPAVSPASLARFPPSLLITGTRDQLMSDVVASHAKLLKAGVESHLYVIEGWGHGTPWNAPDAPESKDTFDVIWKFLDSHLGTRPR
jgi:acetyl esterase/lipase